MSLAQGVRIAFAEENTSKPSIGVDGALPGGWTQVTQIKGISNIKPAEVEKYDDSVLEDVKKNPKKNLNPGSFSFTKRESGSQSKTLNDMALALTPCAWIIVYRNGNGWYGKSGTLTVSSNEAQQGDFKAHVGENFEADFKEPMETLIPD